MIAKSRAEDLLEKYGVTSPEEIDLEAIARCEKIKVRYKKIRGSEARLIGLGERAIVTINPDTSMGRQRFSLAHEIGHWMLDRGSIGKLCKRDDIGPSRLNHRKIDWTEVAANRYASDLLMPRYLFLPSSKEMDIDLFSAEALSHEYRSSLIAAGIQLIKMDHFPSAIAYSEKLKIRWFIKSDSVPKTFWYQDYLQRGSNAYQLVNGDLTNNNQVLNVSADTWISNPGSDKFSVREHSRCYGPGILTIIWWKDESHIIQMGED